MGRIAVTHIRDSYSKALNPYFDMVSGMLQTIFHNTYNK